MMQTRWIKQLAGAFTLAVLTMGAPAQAQQDDAVEGDSIWNLEQRVWGGIVRGLGLRDPNAPQIEYRERSPLVVPPSRDLPPPQTRPKPHDAAWPNDPDRSRKTEAKRKSTASNSKTAIENQGAPIAPSDLDPPGAPRSQPAASDRSNAPAPGADGRPVNPSELGYFGGLFQGRAWGFGGYQDETGTFTNEPARSQLTEPPPGYQTPSPAQPYGVSKRIERSKVEQFDPAGRQ